jgi:hypothetical protein
MNLLDILLQRDQQWVPTGTKLNALESISQRYLAQHKDDRALIGASGVIQAIRGAYGCGRWLDGVKIEKTKD